MASILRAYGIDPDVVVAAVALMDETSKSAKEYSMYHHDLTPPKDCPKCGFKGEFEGPKYRAMMTSTDGSLDDEMEWDCPICEFVQMTPTVGSEAK